MELHAAFKHLTRAAAGRIISLKAVCPAFRKMCEERKGKTMKRLLFVCHGSILRSLEKACYINGFRRSNGAYYTTITPFVKES